MKFLIHIILFLLLGITSVAFSQNEIKFDTIQLSAGAKLPLTLMINEAEVLNLSVIKFIDIDGDLGELPIASISKIIKYGGKVIYPAQVEKKVVVVPKKKKEPAKPICDKTKANEIKLRINEFTKNRIRVIEKEIKELNTGFKEAGSVENEKLIKEFYSTLYSDIMKFKCTEASLISEFSVYVDEKGNFLNFNDKVTSVAKESFYTQLKNTSILQFFQSYSFSSSEKTFDISKEYENMYNFFYSDMLSTNCGLDEFDYALKIAKQEFENLKNTPVSSKTVFKVPLNYTFTKNMQLWKLKNDEITLKGNTEMVLTDPIMREQFFDLIPKKKNGVYSVSICTDKIYEEEMKVDLSQVKKQKNKWIKLGATAIYHVETDVTIGGDKYDLTNQYFYNANLILHRIGFFYGAKYNDPTIITKKDGLFISDNSSYHEGGMFFGLSNSLFLKIGYSSFKGKVEEFDKNGLFINNTNYAKPFTQSGIVGGIALIFPILTIEGGYNYIFDSFYLGVGLNIPVKK